MVVGNEKASRRDVLDIIDIFRETESIKYAQNVLQEFRDKTKACLEVVDQSESKELLSALVDYSLTRIY
jgi:geranylgeranyl pyrophosphate synthase